MASGSKGFERGQQEIVVGDVADESVDGLTGKALPGAQAIAERRNGSQSLRAKFVVPLAAQVIVNDGDGMSLRRKIESSGPSAISVSAEHGNLHISP